MSPELNWLALVATFTALMWIPYILNMIAVRGIADAVGYPEAPKPIAPWAQRMKAAHANAVENLVVFAALVAVVEFTGAGGAGTAIACVVYFWARVVHFIAYTFAVPWVRTLAFAVGFFCQLALAVAVLA